MQEALGFPAAVTAGLFSSCSRSQAFQLISAAEGCSGSAPFCCFRPSLSSSQHQHDSILNLRPELINALIYYSGTSSTEMSKTDAGPTADNLNIHMKDMQNQTNIIQMIRAGMGILLGSESPEEAPALSWKWEGARKASWRR